jgi:sulfane dehydrogenase subunit SoxC
VLLAYEMNGAPLLPQHGFPLRLLVPGWYGMTSVKWLTRIEVVAEPFEGYQMTAGYRFRRDEDDEGHPVTRIQPRALMVPPGIPDFDTRARIVEAGPCPLQGRAWSGWAPVDRVEVSADGGETWAHAELEPLGSPWAWRGWRYEWDAEEPGEYVLCCRASDEAGNVQPDEPIWNVGGYSNNALQRVPVTVQ